MEVEDGNPRILGNGWCPASMGNQGMPCGARKRVRMGKDCLPLEHGLHVVVRDGRDIEQAEWTADEGGRPSGGGTGTGTGGHILRRDEGYDEGGERSSQRTQDASNALPYWIKGSKPSNRVLLPERCMSSWERNLDPKAYTEGVRLDRPIVRGPENRARTCRQRLGEE